MPITYSPYTRILTSPCTSVKTTGKLKSDTYYYRSPVSKRPRPSDSEIVFFPTAILRQRATAFDLVTQFSVGSTCIYMVSGKPVHTPVVKHVQSSFYDSVGFGRPTVPLTLEPSNSKIISKVKDQKVNLAMFLAEYRETSRMFVEVARSLISFYRQIRKGHRLSLLARGTLNSPSTWLMYRYGMNPLISDLKGALELLTQTPNRGLYLKVKVKHEAHTETLSPLYFEGSKVGVKRTKSDTVVRDIVWVEFSSENWHMATSLGLTNPVQLGYELIPFSFVFDWFINVGDYLASLDVLSGIKRYAFTRSTKSTVVEKWIVGTAQPEGNFAQYNRAIRSLTLPVPSWNPSLTWKRTTDVVAFMKNIYVRDFHHLKK